MIVAEERPPRRDVKTRAIARRIIIATAARPLLSLSLFVKGVTRLFGAEERNGPSREDRTLLPFHTLNYKVGFNTLNTFGHKKKEKIEKKTGEKKAR